MGSLISKFIAPYEAPLIAAAGIAILVWGMWEVHHQRQIGAARVVAADAAARADEHKKVVAEEARLQSVADTAERERNVAIKTLQDYATAHPVGSVRLCNRTGNKPAGVPQTGGSVPGPTGAGSGPAAVPEVLGGGAGPDIGPAVDAILSAAETVDGLYKATQPVTSRAN